MNITKQIAKQFSDMHFGGNWTDVNLKETLADVDWEQATKKVYSFNTIASLVYHCNYYVSRVSEVLKGEQLKAHDNFNFAHPPIESQNDWNNLLDKTWLDAENFVSLIVQLPDNKLWEIFEDERYGTYYKNKKYSWYY